MRAKTWLQLAGCSSFFLTATLCRQESILACEVVAAGHVPGEFLQLPGG